MRIAFARSLATAVAMVVSVASLSSAQGVGADPGPADAARPEYSQTIGRATPTEIIQQKAQAKASLRGARIAAREWYGYSQARPTTAAVPMCGMYGPQFNGQVLGRPAAVYPQRPILVLSR